MRDQQSAPRIASPISDETARGTDAANRTTPVAHSLARLGWMLAGASSAMGLVSLLTIGPLLILLGVILIAALVVTQRTRSAWDWPFLVVGAAAAPLWLAVTNWGGPGTRCTGNGENTRCLQLFNPWWFLGAAVVLCVVGLALHRLLRRAR